MAESNVTVVCEVVNENTVSCDGEEYHNEGLFQPNNALFWVYLVLYLVLVLFAGTQPYVEASRKSAVASSI